ncbi:MAG: hypothetical protein K9L02_05950 [Acholeplasmataceae bacterium]|nr:hypothetical protein [Acholeplasmataceae bacterium]
MPFIAYALSDGLFISIFSIIVVFLIILLVSVVIKLFQYFEEKPLIKQDQIETKKILRIEDITDEDMMVAALVASIDYQDSIKGDVRVTSIKEIK